MIVIIIPALAGGSGGPLASSPSSAVLMGGLSSRREEEGARGRLLEVCSDSKAACIRSPSPRAAPYGHAGQHG